MSSKIPSVSPRRSSRTAREPAPALHLGLPKVALLGRPNVGKSSLFNRLIRSKRAITHDRPGVTRDRMEGTVHTREGQHFILIDTGGISLSANPAVQTDVPQGLRGFEAEILAQAEAAIEEAAVLCLVLDAREGLTPFDEALANRLRRANKPVLGIVNKVDGPEQEELLLTEFHRLGFPLLGVSAEHGHNVRALEDDIAELLPVDDNFDSPEADLPELPELIDEKDSALEKPDDRPPADPNGPIKICLLGRPNAGKSSLLNALVNDERMIVSDIAGTTRDSVDVPFLLGKQPFIFVDTAGIRRPSRINDSVERFSVNSSLKSTTKAHITFFLIDATEGLTSQDKRLIDLLDTRKTPFLIVLNKIDLVPKKEQAALLKTFREALTFCPHIPLFATSALKGEGLKPLLPAAKKIFKECTLRVPTGQLNRAMEEILGKHQAPVVRRVRPKFYYLTQAETNPPTFVFFLNDADRVAESYIRYLEKSLRNLFKIEHAPMRVHLRSSHKKK